MHPDEGSGASLLEQVLERIGDRSTSLSAFCRAYLQRLPYDSGMDVGSAIGEITALFEFIQVPGGPVDVRVFNPDESTHGYTSPGTVVEIRVEDTPFLVDSVTAELQAHGLEVVRVLHPVIGVSRATDGRLLEVKKATETEHREAVQHYLLDRRLEALDHSGLEERVRAVVSDVLAAVGDFEAMVEAAAAMARIAQQARGHYPDADVDEAVEFLEWLPRDNFVFLGYREYRLIDTPSGLSVVVDPDSGLGILADSEVSKLREPVPLSTLADEAVNRYRSGGLVVVSKTNRVSTVHRRARMDYIGVRRLAADGSTIGELRLLGLFTSRAYMESVTRIPILRRKLEAVTSSEDLIEGSHDHKAVVSLIESFPKDELFGLPAEDLRRVVMGLLALQERARVRLFVRRDLLDRGVRILVAMPRERYTADLRRRLQALFVERFGGVGADHHLSLDRTDIARLHFTVWMPPGVTPQVEFEKLETEVMAMTRSWSEQVVEVLAARLGVRRAGEVVERWARRLPDYYKSSTQVSVAAGDIENLEMVTAGDEASRVAVQNEFEGPDVLTRITLYERGGKRPLSELTPALENMGLTVVEEVPTRLLGDEETFMHDFGVLDADGEQLDIDQCGERVARALEAVWRDGGETDSLDRLVLAAGLDHGQVAVLRAYQTYWRRVSPIFTVNYVNDALAANPEITAGLVELFALRFDPALDGSDYGAKREALLARLEDVPSLDEDRILRGFLRLIDATVRTNAYVVGRRSFVLKLRSADVPDMPTPRPEVELFVVGPDVEGIHLRAGLRARGGIRWSERREDYRTEVLGLMKAQITKNAVIVPTGAKGGFVVRRSGPVGPAEAEGAYETYIRGLLDVTDDLVDGEAVAPDRVRLHDGPDPYLVVAADRGTAQLSDLANRIAREYGFWLDDAFASGGGSGYDHKALGITARGAWKSLERHFLGLGIDPSRDPFTVVGIGDMSGDVFGNGMLLSDRIRLIAAFDHRHIFLDPDPDPDRSFAERKRLFAKPNSSWDDYDRGLLSAGGGVYARGAKKVELSEQARQALGTTAGVVTPAELIRIVLRAPVDLLWNGGIGTYVKAGDETHEDVEDRANDSVRVDAGDLRARVVVEGGNLGLTHRARIEFARAGGLINADFIDNSAGVNCSDREVNLKILLGLAEERGWIDRPRRDALLAEAADEVVDAILGDNLAQAHRLALDEAESVERLDAYHQLIADLEEGGYLDRDEDYLPDNEEMERRAREGVGLTRPELAVVLAHAKRRLADDITASHLPDSPEFASELRGYFPAVMAARFEDLIWQHPLRRELIATIVANDIVNSQGPTFVSRLVRRRGVAPADIVLAFRTARSIAGNDMRSRIEGLFGRIDSELWRDMIRTDSQLISVLTRWYLTRVPGEMDEVELEHTKAGFVEVERHAPEWGALQLRAERRARIERLRAAGVPEELAVRTVVSDVLAHAPDMLAVMRASGRSIADVGTVFYRVGRAVGLDILEDLVRRVRVADRWQRWALQTLEDDLLALRRSLAERVLVGVGAEAIDDAVEDFLSRRAADVRRVVAVIASLAEAGPHEVTPLVVAARQIEELARIGNERQAQLNP